MLGPKHSMICRLNWNKLSHYWYFNKNRRIFKWFLVIIFTYLDFFIIIFNYDWYFSFICFIHFRIVLYNLPGHPLISAIADGFTRAKDVISITDILFNASSKFYHFTFIRESPRSVLRGCFRRPTTCWLVSTNPQAE